MESGVIGGIPERRPDFGVAFNPSAFLTQDNQFVGFNGGHIDTAILSFVEFDQFGNINVSKLGLKLFWMWRLYRYLPLSKKNNLCRFIYSKRPIRKKI